MWCAVNIAMMLHSGGLRLLPVLRLFLVYSSAACGGSADVSLCNAVSCLAAGRRMKRSAVQRVEAGWNRLPGSHQKKKHPGKHSHLVPPGKLAEGVSPGRAFPWILNNEISPVHCWPVPLRRHLPASSPGRKPRPRAWKRSR